MHRNKLIATVKSTFTEIGQIASIEITCMKS